VALFDTSRRALSFALNYSAPTIKAPTMNSMLSNVEPPKNWMDIPTARKVRRDENVVGYNAAATAGQILMHLAQLPSIHRLVVHARCLPPRLHCDCHSKCCSGWKPSEEWLAVIDAICLVLRDVAKLRAHSERRGMSSHPLLRRAIVEKHYNPEYPFTVAAVSERCDVSEATVYNHKAVFIAYLVDVEKQAWTELDHRLVAADIVGSLT